MGEIVLKAGSILKKRKIHEIHDFWPFCNMMITHSLLVIGKEFSSSVFVRVSELVSLLKSDLEKSKSQAHKVV